MIGKQIATLLFDAFFNSSEQSNQIDNGFIIKTCIKTLSRILNLPDVYFTNKERYVDFFFEI